MPLLSILIWLPVIGGILVLMTGGDNNAHIAKWLSLLFTFVILLLCIPLYHGFSTTTYHMQFKEFMPWITSFGINYSLGVDGISMPMIILTCFTSLIVVLAAWQSVSTKVAQYLAAFLIMEGMMIGVFAARDSMLFYVFWESMLVPMYLAIGIWGSANRNYASIKFFLFTFFGSALMLIALLYLGMKANSFDIQHFYPLKLTMEAQVLIFVAFLLAFAVKVPMWPVHTWLPDAHTEAPAGGSVILAALMLKMGAYGFFRFSLPIVPDASHHLSWLMITLSLIAIVYIGFVALAQTDMKKLIAYSSVAHMGFVTLGCFMIYQIVAHTGKFMMASIAMEGAMVQMISHAFGAGAMFLGVGVLYDRMHTRQIKDFGGIAHTMPLFAAFFMIFALSNVGLPGTSGFVGEFMVILSAMSADFWVALLAAATLVIGPAYTLYMYKRVFLGPVVNDEVKNLAPLKGTEITVLGLLAALVLLLGVYPQILLQLFHPTISHLLHLAEVSKIA